MNMKQEDYMSGIIEENNLDDFGPLTEPFPENATKFDCQKINQYCRERNIHVSDMTQEELKQFFY